MASKLTSHQRNAQAFISRVSPYDSFSFHVYWKKSRTWGLCPSILDGDVVCARASGCGYDKLSAVLTDFLCWLYPADAPEHREIRGHYGAGVPTLRRLLLSYGWELDHVHAGKVEDGFVCRRKQQQQEMAP